MERKWNKTTTTKKHIGKKNKTRKPGNSAEEQKETSDTGYILGTYLLTMQTARQAGSTNQIRQKRATGLLGANSQLLIGHWSIIDCTSPSTYAVTKQLLGLFFGGEKTCARRRGST